VSKFGDIDRATADVKKGGEKRKKERKERNQQQQQIRLHGHSAA